MTLHCVGTLAISAWRMPHCSGSVWLVSLPLAIELPEACTAIHSHQYVTDAWLTLWNRRPTTS